MVITDKLAGELVTNVMPEVPSGITGFFVNITDNGTAVDIGLVGRFDPTYGVWAGPDNPQVCMKTRLISPSSSSN